MFYVLRNQPDTDDGIGFPSLQLEYFSSFLKLLLIHFVVKNSRLGSGTLHPFSSRLPFTAPDTSFMSWSLRNV